MQLAWILSSFPIPDDEESLFGASRAELDTFRKDFVRRLAEQSFPGDEA